MRSGMGPGPDDQEPLIQFVKHAGTKIAGKGKGKGMGITENGKSAHKSGKHIKVEEGMEVEVAGKNLVENRARKPNTIAGKSSVEDRAGEPAGVANKSSDVTVSILGSAAKSETTIVERLETPMIFRTRVPITSNLNNPALIPPPFASPQLGTGISTLMPVSFVILCHRLGSLSSITHAPKTTPGPQVPL